jgi:hypothetical protein
MKINIQKTEQHNEPFGKLGELWKRHLHLMLKPLPG